MPDKTYSIASEQTVPRSLEEVFAFFSRAENLERITPPWLKFRILTVIPEPIRKGTVISYRLRLHGIPLRWASEIVEWEPPYRFVDLQLRGPYKFWRHDHRFAACDGGTLISDRVNLVLPLGFLGQIAYRIKVRSDMQEVFTYRESRIRALFA
jgi:ligand-binding SRPBCC domain-containing protein